VVDALDFEDDGAYTVIAAGNHGVLVAHPPLHYRTALQTSIDVAGYGIPCLGAKRLLRSACNLIGLAISLDERIQTAMPVIIALIITIENKLIAFVIDRALAGTWISSNNAADIPDIAWCRAPSLSLYVSLSVYRIVVDSFLHF